MGTSEQPFTQSELQTRYRHCIIYRDLVRSSGAASMHHQPQLPGLEEWLPETAAAELVGLDTKTLRNMRAGNGKGIVPFKKYRGRVLYPRADLESWLALNKRRKAGTLPGKTTTQQ